MSEKYVIKKVYPWSSIQVAGSEAKKPCDCMVTGFMYVFDNLEDLREFDNEAEYEILRMEIK